MNNIIKKSYKVSDLQVLTNIGFVDINNIIKTIKFKKYYIYFTGGIEISFICCADKHVFIDICGDEIYACDLKPGYMIESKYGCIEVYEVIQTDEYIEMYDLNLNNHHLFYTNKILSHNSNTMANFAARQVIHGKNVVIMTLEMSEVMFSQRFDSIFSLKDINQMYFSSNRRDLVTKLKDVQNAPHGKLHIKQFPTGAASVNNFKSYLRELRMHGEEFDIIYVDYINLMKPAIIEGDNLYSKVKTIAEELRALSFEFEVPVVSVSQLNREGSFAGFKDVNFNYIAESHGVPATADFMSIFGTDPDALIYESELHNKIVKNRFGPVGDILKMFYDSRNLKMYDQEEEDLWMEDAQRSGDERNPAPPPPEPQNTQRRGRR